MTQSPLPLLAGLPELEAGIKAQADVQSKLESMQKGWHIGPRVLPTSLEMQCHCPSKESQDGDQGKGQVEGSQETSQDP